MAECDRLQSWQSVAAAGAAKEDRGLVLDELAATVGQDGGATGEARSLLLADAGREPFDAAAFRGDGAANRSVAAAERIGRGGQEANRVKEGGGTERCMRNRLK